MSAIPERATYGDVVRQAEKDARPKRRSMLEDALAGGVFAFAVGTPAAQVYAELVGRPGLSAFVTADKSARYFLGVTFRHSP